jgi:hypothetical protein
MATSQLINSGLQLRLNPPLPEQKNPQKNFSSEDLPINLLPDYLIILTTVALNRNHLELIFFVPGGHSRLRRRPSRRSLCCISINRGFPPGRFLTPGFRSLHLPQRKLTRDDSRGSHKENRHVPEKMRNQAVARVKISLEESQDFLFSRHAQGLAHGAGYRGRKTALLLKGFRPGKVTSPNPVFLGQFFQNL